MQARGEESLVTQQSLPLFGLVVLVCGGRDYADRERVRAVLDDLLPARVVCGGARGADALAAEWARSRGVALGEYPADWDRHGNAAGALRNAEMLRRERVDLVVAFLPGPSGTRNMVRRAEAKRVSVRKVDW